VSEIPGKGHWWGGVVDDSIMQNFFNEHFSLSLPTLPDSWIVTSFNPSSTEGRGGIRVLFYYKFLLT
jgi:hypothetical protein